MISIFVLEDDADSNVGMLQTLHRLKTRVFMALSVESAEKILQENAPPDVILLHLKSPAQSGYPLVEMLRGGRIIPPFSGKLAFFDTAAEYDECRRKYHETMAVKMMQIPVIVISSSNSVKDILRGKQLGVTDYILKPADPERLLRKIADCTSGHFQL